MTLAAAKQQGKVALTVPAPFSQSVSLKLQISENDRKKLKLPSRIIASATRSLGTPGAFIVTLTPGSKAAKAIAKRNGPTNVTILATSGILTDTAGGSITG